MGNLDIRTLVSSFIIVDISIVVIMIVLFLQAGRKFPGTLFWIFDFAFQTISVILISIRGSIPDFISIVVSNSLGMTGTFLGLYAFYSFFDRKLKINPGIFVLAIYTGLLYYFSIIKPDLAVRNLNYGIAALIFSLQYFYFVFRTLKNGARKLARGVGLVFASYAVVNLLRILYFFFSDNNENDYFRSGFFDAFVFICYQVLFILLTYSLVLMYNNKLLSIISLEKEKFSKVFNSSPYAVILTRLSDGGIIDVNPGFERITGYTREESVGKSTIGLRLWQNDEDRDLLVRKLSEKEEIFEDEYNFRTKTGRIITGSISAQVIIINEIQSVISSINDITEKKKSEKILKEKIEDLEKLNRFMTDREMRMIELKKEVNDIRKQIGMPQKYESRETDSK